MVNSEETDICYELMRQRKGKEMKVLKDMRSTEVLAPMMFPTKNGKEFEVGVEKIKQWMDAYPYINVVEEMRSCLQWNIDNPSKRKTANGMHRHIGNWLRTANQEAKTRLERYQPKQDKDDWRKEYV